MVKLHPGSACSPLPGTFAERASSRADFWSIRHSFAPERIPGCIPFTFIARVLRLWSPPHIASVNSCIHPLKATVSKGAIAVAKLASRAHLARSRWGKCQGDILSANLETWGWVFSVDTPKKKRVKQRRMGARWDVASLCHCRRIERGDNPDVEPFNGQEVARLPPAPETPIVGPRENSQAADAHHANTSRPRCSWIALIWAS